MRSEQLNAVTSVSQCEKEDQRQALDLKEDQLGTNQQARMPERGDLAGFATNHVG